MLKFLSIFSGDYKKFKICIYYKNSLNFFKLNIVYSSINFYNLNKTNSISPITKIHYLRKKSFWKQ